MTIDRDMCCFSLQAAGAATMPETALRTLAIWDYLLSSFQIHILFRNALLRKLIFIDNTFES